MIARLGPKINTTGDGFQIGYSQRCSITIDMSPRSEVVRSEAI